MKMKLRQNYFLKGTREFEIVGDMVHVRIKRPFKEEKLTIALQALDPEPVVNGSEIEFHGRDNQQTLLSLTLNKPNAEAFNAFVDSLKLLVLKAFQASGDRAGSPLEGLAANVFEAPPDLDDFDQVRQRISGKTVDAERIGKAIDMLRMYLDSEEIAPLLAALEAVQAEPQNESYLMQMLDVFDGLGITQGAVLTYAPYIGYLLTDDPYRND